MSVDSKMVSLMALSATVFFCLNLSIDASDMLPLMIL